MADASVQFLLNKIDAVLTRELTLPEKVNSGVNNLKRELEMMTAFLEEADYGAEQNKLILVWVRQVQDIAHNIEDVLDMIALHMAEEHVSRTNRLRNWKRNHSMADFIDKIEQSLKKLTETRERYPINNSSGASGSMLVDHFPPRTAYLSLKEAEIVAIEDDKDRMISWALDWADSFKVLFVAGMGGSGKTTLVKQVFDVVKEEFNCHAWITVSKNEKLDILHKLLKELCNSTAESISQQSPPLETEVDLVRKLQKFLQFRSYAIVLDDLWLNDVWESIKHALPRGNSSRIIITTRRGDIAYSLRDSSISVHKVQPLPGEKAEKLFHRKAFPTDGWCPPELVRWSDAFLRKCEGLPLAISEIGQILSAREKTPFEWRKMYDSLASELRRNGRLENIRKVLMLSYHDLPYHLKYCFLFMNVFPCDSRINSRKLIRLWMAEGFIKEETGKELEDVGEEYLKELIDRSLVQVSELDFDGRPKTCRVHNIMHDIIPSKSQDEGFCAVCSQEQNGDTLEKTRRISIQAKEIKMPRSCPDPSARTLLMFSPDTASPCPRPDINYTSFKLLKTLQLQGFNLDTFPEEIEELLLLRYLSLRNTGIKRVPSSIGKLRHLETLDLKQTMVTKLPKEIKNLTELRHLFVYRYDMGLYLDFHAVKGFEVSADITALTNLQKLSFVRAQSHHTLIPRKMGLCDTLQMLQHLQKLKKLGIIDLSTRDGKSLCWTIQRLQKLYSLSLTSVHIDEVLDIKEISHPPQLQRLYLKGKLERMPNWISRLHDLVRLRLKWSRLPTSSNPIEVLQDLPNLLELQLLDAYTGNQLDFNAGKFQKLKVLEFERLEQLIMVIMEDSTLPCLQKLIIRQCNRLGQVPVGIDNLSCLQELLLCDMPRDFVKQIRKGGIMHNVVQHIPSLIHFYYSQEHREWIGENLHDFSN